MMTHRIHLRLETGMVQLLERDTELERVMEIKQRPLLEPRLKDTEQEQVLELIRQPELETETESQPEMQLAATMVELLEQPARGPEPVQALEQVQERPEITDTKKRLCEKIAQSFLVIT